MGANCCCLHLETLEDYMHQNNSLSRYCPCLPCFFQNFFHVCAVFFRRQVHSHLPSIQWAAPAASSLSSDNSLSSFNSSARPLPFDADTGYFPLQRDDLITSFEKGSSHSNEEPKGLSMCKEDDSNYVTVGGKLNVSGCVIGSKERQARSSPKLFSAKSNIGYEYMYSSLEDEEICPTCLEEYTKDNPKIMTRCSHHFHLGCIYEWMERSDCCPVCGKVMELDEAQ